MKLLAVVDSPHLTTGFGKVGAALLKRWGASGAFERIDIWGIGHLGYPGDPGKVQEEWYNRPPFVRYPQAHPSFWTSQQNLQGLVSQIAGGDYTHVWIIQDHFNLINHQFHVALRAATTKLHKEGPRKDVRTLFYCPVDAELEPQWAAACQGFDEVVAYTEYGKRELEAQLGDLGVCGARDAEGSGYFIQVGRGSRFGPCVRVIPHGVEEVFRVLPWTAEEREQARAAMFGGFVQPGDTVLLNVNANQRRKDVGRTLEILAALKVLAARATEGRSAALPALPRFKLVMHMNRFGANQEQLDLEKIAEQLGLEKNVDWIHLGHLFGGAYGTLTDEKLNELYNLSDIYLTTTLGEGWGMGITEAAAAGCVVAVPEHTACEEQGNYLEHMDREVIWLPLEEGRVWLPGDNCRGRRRVRVMPAAERIIQAVVLGSRSNREGIRPDLRADLSWDRIADEWLKLMLTPRPDDVGEQARQEPRPTTPRIKKRPDHFYIEMGGGLGDIFNALYHRGRINLFRDLPDGATATVALCCHNPFAKEIFEHHPKVLPVSEGGTGQIQVLDLGYWDPKEDRKKRELLRLPRRGSDYGFEAPDLSATLRNGVDWYLGPEDNSRAVLRSLWGSKIPYVVVAAGAGLPHRNIPQEILDHAVNEVRRAFPTMMLVLVGRTFDRCGKREEPTPSVFKDAPWISDLRDQLTVPGTALLLQKAQGLVTAHSALNILGWNQDRYHGPELPQLVLYPESVLNFHFLWTTQKGREEGRKKDEWSWGADNGRTAHGLFEDYKELTGKFVELVGK